MNSKDLSNYKVETIVNRKLGNASEKVIRIYQKDKKLLNREQILRLSEKIRSRMTGNQTYMSRIMTEYGKRTLKGLDEDDENFIDNEEYLKGSTNEGAKSYKKIFYIDYHLKTNDLN